MKFKTPTRQSLASKWITLAVIITLLLSGYSLYTVLMLKPGDTAVIPPGITVQKNELKVSGVNISEDGELMVSYSDGKVQNVGKVRGDKSTVDVISVAVADYCVRNKCDGYPPSQADVLNAVVSYCTGDTCKNIITPDQILAQVELYCTNGNCQGPIGATGSQGPIGATGNAARQPIWACVLVTEDKKDVRYYTQKYADEPDSSYLTWEFRSKLPDSFVPNSCIDMRV